MKGFDKLALAQVVHEVNRAYCLSIGDNNQPAWENATEEQKNSSLALVDFHLKNPDASPSASHDRWYDERVAGGWTYGPVRDNENKIHPALVPYEQLTTEQKSKDYLVKQVVDSLGKFLN